VFRVEGSLSLGSGQTPGNDSDGEVPQASEDMADVFRRVWLLGDVFDMITGSPLVSASFVQSLACSEPPDPRAFHPNLRLLALTSSRSGSPSSNARPSTAAPPSAT